MPEIDYDELKGRLAKVPAENREAFLQDVKSKGYTWKTPGASSDPKTGDTTTADEQSLTYPVRHPIDFAKKQGLTLAGAGEGSAVGAEVGSALGPVGTFAGGVIGAGLGAASGNMATRGFESVDKAMNPGLGAQTSLKQNVYSSVKSGESMAEAEAIARPVGAVAGKVAGKVWKAVKPTVSSVISDATQKGIAAAQELGIPLTVGQLGQSKWLLGLEGVMRASPLFGDLIGAKDLESSRALGAARNSLLTTLGPKTESEGLGVVAKQQMDTRLSAAETSRIQRYGLDKENAASGFASNAVKVDGKWTPESSVPQLPEARRTGMEQVVRQAKAKSLAERGRLYEAADKAHDPGALVSLDPLKKEGQAVIGEYGKAGAPSMKLDAWTTANSYANPAPDKILKGVPDEVVDFVKKNPDMTPPPATIDPPAGRKLPDGSPDTRPMGNGRAQALFQEAQKLNPEQIEAIKSQGKMNVLQLQNEIDQLGDAAEKNKIPGGDYNADGRQYLRMKNAAQGALDAHFADAAPEAQRLYKLADAFHGAYAETYRNATLRKIWGENPNATFLSIAQGGSDVEIKSMARALNGVSISGSKKGPPQEGVNILKRQLFDQIFSESKNGIPTEAEVMQGLSKYGPAVRSLFNKEDIDSIRRFALRGAGIQERIVGSGSKATVTRDEAPQFIQSEYDKAAKGLIAGSPQDLTKHILSGNVLLAQAAKKYLPSATWDAFGRQLAENITTAAPKGELEAGYSGIRGRVAQYDPAYLREFYKPGVVEGMGKIGDASQILPGYGDLAQKTQSNMATGGRMTMMMAGMIMYRLGSPKLGMLVMGAPLVGQLYTSEMGQKFLTTLMRMPSDDPRVGKVVQRAMQYLGRTVSTNPKIKAALTTRRIPAPDPAMGLIGARKDVQP